MTSLEIIFIVANGHLQFLLFEVQMGWAFSVSAWLRMIGRTVVVEIFNAKVAEIGMSP